MSDLCDICLLCLKQINIVHDNVVNVDLLTAHPTCIFIYLVPAAMKLLKDTLRALLLSGDCLIVTYGAIEIMSPFFLIIFIRLTSCLRMYVFC